MKQSLSMMWSCRPLQPFLDRVAFVFNSNLTNKTITYIQFDKSDTRSYLFNLDELVGDCL